MSTLAVAAGRLLGERNVTRVVLVTTDPGYLEGFPDAVVAAGLGLPLSTPVAVRVGGAPAAVDAVLSAPDGTLIVAVTAAQPAGAVAALVDAGGSLELCAAGVVNGYLPTRVRTTAGATAFYEDARLERERGVGPAVATLAAGADTVALAGDPAGALRRAVARVTPVHIRGAAGGLLALADLAERDGGGRVVAVDGPRAVAADVRGALPVQRAARVAVAVAEGPGAAVPGAIGLSLPGLDRAFESKIGLLATACACDALHHPPREVCPVCGDPLDRPLVALPRTGEVYSVVTVRTPVPGVPGPYSLAVVQLDGVAVRLLAPVCDTRPGSARIGDRGELVLRRIAVREGVPDYGYAFRPDEKEQR